MDDSRIRMAITCYLSAPPGRRAAPYVVAPGEMRPRWGKVFDSTKRLQANWTFQQRLNSELFVAKSRSCGEVYRCEID